MLVTVGTGSRWEWELGGGVRGEQRHWGGRGEVREQIQLKKLET